MSKITFSGNGQAGNLLNANNWVGGKVPGLDDSATISMNVGGPVNGTFEVCNLMLLGPEQITFTGTLDTFGNPSDCQGLMVCVGAGAVFAPGATLNDTGVFVVGNGKPGTVLAEGSGSTHSVLNTVAAKFGAMAGGVGTVTISDAIWTNSSDAVIGNVGAGTLNVTNGGAVHLNANAYMGMYTGSTASMTITSGSSVAVTALMRDGACGVSSVNVASGGSLTVGSSLVVGTGSSLALTGGTVSGGVTSDCVRIMTGGVISGSGTVASPDGQAILDNGNILATGGTLAMTGSVAGTGTLQIAANSTATVSGSVLNLASIGFIGANATLALAHGTGVWGSLTGFALGDMISEANVTAVSFTASTGVLKLMQNTTLLESLHFAGNFTGDTFGLHQVAGSSIIALQHS